MLCCQAPNTLPSMAMRAPSKFRSQWEEASVPKAIIEDDDSDAESLGSIEIGNINADHLLKDFSFLDSTQTIPASLQSVSLDTAAACCSVEKLNVESQQHDNRTKRKALDRDGMAKMMEGLEHSLDSSFDNASFTPCKRRSKMAKDVLVSLTLDDIFDDYDTEDDEGLGSMSNIFHWKKMGMNKAKNFEPEIDQQPPAHRTDRTDNEGAKATPQAAQEPQGIKHFVSSCRGSFNIDQKQVSRRKEKVDTLPRHLKSLLDAFSQHHGISN